jgi:hypothetical protein
MEIQRSAKFGYWPIYERMWNLQNRACWRSGFSHPSTHDAKFYKASSNIMSDKQNTQKTLEVKIRTLPGQERQDQKDVSRVFLSIDTLRDFPLRAGQPCYLWKIDDPQSQHREAVVYPSTQKLNKNVLQMFKTFQEACGFKLDDRVAMASAEDFQTVSCVVLRDASSISALNEKERPHWEWYLSDKLGQLFLPPLVLDFPFHVALLYTVANTPCIKWKYRAY